MSSTREALYLSVNIFSTKVLIEDTIFTSPTGDGIAVLLCHPSHAKVQQGKGRTFISQLSNTLGIVPVPEIEPATSRFAVKRSTD